MKNKHPRPVRLCALLLVLAMLLACVAGCSSSGDDSLTSVIKKERLRIGYIVGDDSAPLVFEENGEMTGLVFDIAEEICSRLNCKAEYVPISAGELVDTLESGNVDCIIGCTVSNHKTAAQLETAPMQVKKRTVVAVRDSSNAERLVDLKGKIISSRVGSDACAQLTMASELSGALEEIRYETDWQTVLDSVTKGDAYGAVIEETTLRYLTRKNYGEDFSILTQYLHEEDYVVACKKGSTALCERIEQILLLMDSDGTLDRVCRPWLAHMDVGSEGFVYPLDEIPVDTGEDDSLSASDLSASDLSASDLSASDTGSAN